MKNILAWMKGHVAVVALSAVVLLTLPTAFAVSSVLNGSLRKGREAEVNKDHGDLVSAKVTYHIPAVKPGEASIPFPWDAPNETITKWFKEQRETRSAQVAEVVKLATEINRAGHEVLLAGLFPAPPSDDPVGARLDFVELLTGKGDMPSVYQRLFDDIHAGGPADPVALKEELKELEQRDDARLEAEVGKRERTPEEKAELDKKLLGQRLGRYQRRSSEISVYATMECLPPHPELPRKPFNDPQDVWQCFEWQWDYWVVADILKAVGAANTDASGQWTPVEDSAVKRVEKIRVQRLPLGDKSAARDDWAPTGLGTAKAPLDDHYSITGRRTSKHNSMYDVRDVTLEVVVDSARARDLINAISRTNFMTVVGCELREMDPWQDLNRGYDYGSDHVMKAKLKIETVWLRSWTEPLMPEDIKADLGIAATEAPAAAAPTPAPAPPPVRRAPAAEDDGEGGRRRRGGGGGG